MPTRQDHLAKSEHNELLSRTLESTRYTDWAVTTLFYAALHLVDAYLLTLGMDPKDHEERLQQVFRTAQLRPIWGRYRNLLDRSIDARYECSPFLAAHVEPLRQNTYAPLKQHLRSLLGA